MNTSTTPIFMRPLLRLFILLMMRSASSQMKARQEEMKTSVIWPTSARDGQFPMWNTSTTGWSIAHRNPARRPPGDFPLSPGGREIKQA